MKRKNSVKVEASGPSGFGAALMRAGINRFEQAVQDAAVNLIGDLLGLKWPAETSVDAQAVATVADAYKIGVAGTKRRGRPPGSKNAKSAKVAKAKGAKTGRKRRKMSAEARQRIIDAQTRRWARVRRMAKAKANAIASAKAKAKIAKDKAAKDKAKTKTRKPGKATKARKSKVPAALETSSTSMAA